MNKPGVATDRSECADRAVDPSRDELLGFFEELDRSGDFHNGGAPYHAEIEGVKKETPHLNFAANCLT
jgi:hypothetical protein